MHGGLATVSNTRRDHMAERYPGGKIKSPKGELPRSHWKRIKDHAIKLGAHPDMGSEVGRLSLYGVLKDSEAAAAIWVAEAYGRYERLNGLPHRTSASPAYERSYGRSPQMQNPEKAEKELAASKKNLETINRCIAKSTTVAFTGRARAALEDLCCHDVETPESLKGHLAALLAIIAKEKGL